MGSRGGLLRRFTIVLGRWKVCEHGGVEGVKIIRWLSRANVLIAHIETNYLVVTKNVKYVVSIRPKCMGYSTTT